MPVKKSIKWVKDGNELRLLIPGRSPVKVKQSDAIRLATWINDNMSEIWKPKDHKLLQEWIDAILEEASDELSDWENSFMASIQRRLDRTGELSQSQEDTLERIYAAKTK
jgi:hypothetical protein